MRLLKGVLIAITGLFIVVTIMSLLMPSKVMTSRTVAIHGTNEEIMAQLSDLKNWRNWHPVFKNEQDIVFSEPSAGKGAFAEWRTGNKENRLKLDDTTATMIRIILQRKGENELPGKIELFESKDPGTMQVEWSSVTYLKWYPWEKFAGIFIEKMTGPAYEEALNELRSFIEKN